MTFPSILSAIDDLFLLKSSSRVDTSKARIVNSDAMTENHTIEKPPPPHAITTVANARWTTR